MKNFKSILIVVFLMVILSSCNTTKTVSSTPWHDPDMKIIKKSSEKLYLPFYQKGNKKNQKKNKRKNYLPWYNPPEEIHSRDPFYENN